MINTKPDMFDTERRILSGYLIALPSSGWVVAVNSNSRNNSNPKPRNGAMAVCKSA
jgi:hypothetical protein